MRNLIIAVAVIALAAIGYFAFAANKPATETPVAAAASATPAETAATDSAAADTAVAATPSSTSAPAETVEESSAAEEPSSEEADLTLAQAAPAAAPAESKFKAGQHYRELVPTQPTVHSSDKIEVVEVFWYGCNHCFSFEPYINRWADDLAPDVEFVRMPVIWPRNEPNETHAKAFYRAEALANNGALKDPQAFHEAFFKEIQVNQRPLLTDRALQAFFERFGVSADAYNDPAVRFEVDRKVRTAKDLTRRYKISGVPAIVVNGRYTNISNAVRSYEEYLQLIDELVAKERG